MIHCDAMRRRCFLFSLIILLSVGACGGSPASEENYNVILISIDTLRADHLSCYGYFRETSPTIDKFAENALLFSNTFSASSSTLPSHMSIFTAVTPTVHEMMVGRGYIPLSRKIKTLPEILKANGYRTFGYFDGAFLHKDYGFGRGFDIYKLRSPEKVQEAIDSLYKEAFFLFVHYFEVHSSEFTYSEYLYDGPPEFRDKFTQGPLEHNPRGVWRGKTKLTDRELEQVIARYDGGISHVDFLIEELFRALREKYLYEESLIVVTSDHGESLGFKGMIAGHGGLYDVGTHVPLIIKFPKSFASSHPLRGKVDHIVRTIDIMPTILDVMSIESPPYITGKSLLRATENRTSYAQQKDAYSVRTEDLRILFRGSPDLTDKRRIEIYDVVDDPSESVNLYGKDDDRTDKLLQLVDQLHEKENSLKAELEDKTSKPKMLDKERIEHLKALGYLE